MIESVKAFKVCMVMATLWLSASFMVPAVHAEDADPTAAIETLFRQAVDLYEQGKYADAQHKLQEVQAKDPRSPLVARLVDEAGVRIMTKMMADHRMGTEPTRIWEIYRKYKIGKIADKDRMAKMTARLVDAATSEDERAQLYNEFSQISFHAVPYLAKYLADATNPVARSNARIAIARMGRSATLPVIELLTHKDQLMRETAMLILGDIVPVDPRSIPALKARLEDAKESEIAKSYATRILKRITGLDTWKPAAQYYYDAANRYFIDKANVAEEAEEVGGMVWHLNEAGELVYVTYPLWAWNDQMAEENILRGLAVDPEYKPLYALWACTATGQSVEVKDLIDIVNEQPPRHSFSAEEKKDLEDWNTKLIDTRRLVAAVGKENVNAALNKVHADLAKYPGHIRLPGVAASLARELQMLDPKGTLLDADSALVAGLDSKELAVQYASAIVLASLNRFPATWPGCEKVGGILGRGVSENKTFQILLVDEDQNTSNEMAAKLKSLGYGVSQAASGREAVSMARTFPPKDVAIVAENLRRDLNALQTMEELRADTNTRYLPVGIMHLRADHDVVQSRLGSGVVLVERESAGNDLKTPVEKLGEQMSKASPYKARANEIAVLCANALNKINADATHIVLNDAVEHTTLALVNRKDDVRIPCASFLGHVEGGASKDKVAEALKAVFEDANAAVELRRVALRSLGRVKIDGLEELYAKTQTDPDQEIKDIGAEAFGQKVRESKAILGLIRANRIDKAKKEQ